MPCSCWTCQYGGITIPQRYIACLMAFFTIFVNICMRGSLNLLINEMVKHHPGEKLVSECTATSSTIQIHSGTIDWTPVEQASILVSYFYGYLVSHIPGGLFADLYGAKPVLGGTVLLSLIMTVISPWAIENTGYEVVVVIRFIVGLAQGPMFPAVSTLMAKWIPKEERGTLVAVVFSSAFIANIVCFFLTGIISAIFEDWHIVFYFWSIIGLAYLFVHQIFCHSTPEENPHILDDEREMLSSSIGASTRGLKIPWLKLLTDCGCLAVIISWAGHAMPFFYYAVSFPKYLKEVLHYNLVEVGSISSSTQLAAFIGTSLLGAITDRMINKEWISTLSCRRIFGVLGLVGLTGFCQIAAYYRCDRTEALIFFHLSMFCCGLVYASIRVNALDITKNFAGSLMALENGAGALGFWPIPYLIAVMIPDNKTDQWINFYWVMTGFSIVCAIHYAIFVSVEIAEWDKV